MNKLARGFNTATQDSNPGSRNRESEALPLSHSDQAVHSIAQFVSVFVCVPRFYLGAMLRCIMNYCVRPNVAFRNINRMHSNSNGGAQCRY